MGIYDRDYYRDENAGVLDWLLPNGHVCKWLFSIYIVVLFLQLLTFGAVNSADESAGRYGGFTDLFDLNVAKVLHGEVWRLVSYAFLHTPGDFISFVFGMLFLWWFGTDLEHLYGSRSFLAFYLLAILVGGVTFTLGTLWRGGPGIYLWSGGVFTALLTLCAIHFPHRTILIFFILPVPIWVLAFFNIAWNVYQALGGFGTQSVVLVQLASAGFAGGFYKYKRDFASSFSGFFSGLLRWRPRRPQAQLKLYRPEPEQRREPVPVAAAPLGHAVDEHFEAKLDAVLEKIARAGKESLNADEQQILIQASELYKKRRS
jgi:membrane associated rhomboid family serine protease